MIKCKKCKLEMPEHQLWFHYWNMHRYEALQISRDSQEARDTILVLCKIAGEGMIGYGEKI